MDPLTIGCALIHEAITLEKMTFEEIEEMFGADAAQIVNSITKITISSPKEIIFQLFTTIISI